MKEEWKDIYFVENGITYDFRGKYQVSNLGRVKSLNYNQKKREKILKLQKHKDGYLFIKLWKNGKQKLFLVHRLVGFMFIPNPNNLPQVNHKNEIKDCNEYWNLEWCDCEYNNNYGTRRQRIMKKITKQVNQYDLQGNFIKTWDCIIDIEKELGIYHSHISKCCKNRSHYKTTGGYIWKYKKERK